MTRSVPCNWTGTEDASRTSASLLPAPAALRGHCCLAHAPAAPKCQGHLLLPQGPHSGDRNLHMAATPPLATRGCGLAATAVHWCAGLRGLPQASPGSRAPAPVLLLYHRLFPPPLSTSFLSPDSAALRKQNLALPWAAHVSLGGPLTNRATCGATRPSRRLGKRSHHFLAV